MKSHQKPDLNQTVEKAARKALGIGKMNGESLLGSADLKRQFRAAKERLKAGRHGKADRETGFSLNPV